jgi:hypothetical protein
MAVYTSRNVEPNGRPTLGLDSDNVSRAGLHFDASGNPQILNAAGQVAAQWTSVLSVPRTVALNITGAAGSTGVFASIANPFGAEVRIIRAVLRITTASGAASTLDIGVGANAATANDGLFDGLSGATGGLFDNIVAAEAGTNGRPSQVWGSTGFLNVAEASGNVNSLVATLYVTVV